MGISQFCFQAPGASGSQLPGRRLTTERSCRSYWPFPRRGLGLGRACYPSDTRGGARIMMNSMKLQPDTSRITTQNPQIGGVFPLWILYFSTATSTHKPWLATWRHAPRQPPSWRFQNWWPWSLWWPQGAAGDLCTLVWRIADTATVRWYLDRENDDI